MTFIQYMYIISEKQMNIHLYNHLTLIWILDEKIKDNGQKYCVMFINKKVDKATRMN